MSRLSSLRRLASRREKAHATHTSRRVRPVLEALEDRTAPAVLSVNTANDGNVRDAFLSLREALLLANGTLGVADLLIEERSQVTGGLPGAGLFDTIVFSIPGIGVQTIAVTSPLPIITDPVLIDGTSQGGPGYAGSPVIELDGILAGLNTPGLFITAGSSTVLGLGVRSFGGHGIVLSGGGGNVIQGCTIGTDPSGTIAMGNGLSGINIFNSSNNTIGVGSDGVGNVISGNGQDGVAIVGSQSTGNVVAGNHIGTDLNGTLALGNTRNGVLLTSPDDPAFGTGAASNNTIGGSTLAALNVISGNGRDGVQIGFGATGNVVAGNLIGTTGSGVEALGNGRHGVAIFDSPNNTVGGPGVPPGQGAGNVISGNQGNGVFIGLGLSGVGATGNRVVGNLIGLDQTGTTALPNQGAGVHIASSAGNTVGGTALEDRNVISGNAGNGIDLVGTGSVNNQVLGNFIGPDVGGTGAIGNFHGVFIDNVADNTIGGTAAGAGNVISGNAGSGIKVANAGATRTVIVGNDIGTDYVGTGALGNGEHGVLLLDAPGNTVGGSATGAGNLISANGQDGIDVAGSSATNNRIQGNHIGTDAAGNGDLGNRQYGVLVRDGASNNQIGGTADGAGNTIAFNGTDLGARGYGVEVESGTGNAIRRNSIFANSGRGIDLVNPTAPDTFTLNDPGGDADNGANGLQNYPVVVDVHQSAFGKLITWQLNSSPLTTFTIDVFANSFVHPSGFGDGERYLSSLTVDTDAQGDVTFSTLVAPGDNFIAATATDPSNNTSEFSMVDSDADGLADAWETRGIDIDEDGVVDYHLGGGTDPFPANPMRKDIFVEVDAMAGLAPTQDELDVVATAFLNAPVVNSDGSTGIILHAQLDEIMPRQAWTGDLNGNGTDALGGDRNANGIFDPGEAKVPGDPADQGGFPWFYQVKKNGIGGVGGFGTAAERANPLALAAKRLVSRYAIFADRFVEQIPGAGVKVGTSGNSEIGGNDFMVTLGTWANTPEQRMGTFMHELGHSLGLHHGGADDINFKPNYHSVMNYMWQTPTYWMYEDANQNGIQDSFDLDGDGTVDTLETDINGNGHFGDNTWFLDYSRRAYATLDETNLDETKGIGGEPGAWIVAGVGSGPTDAIVLEVGPVDWSQGDANGDGIKNNDTGVSANVNRADGTTLIGHDDWSNLQFSFLENPRFADGATEEGDPDEMTIDDFEALSAVGPGPGILDFRLSADDVREDAGAVTVTVTRGYGTHGTVSVDFATADGSAIAGSDYLAVAGTLTFAEGEYVKTFAVPILNDSAFEGPEAFSVVLSNPRRGATFGLRNTMTVNILDDDPPVFDVTNTNDDGPGSLRQALFAANLNPGVDVITFHNPGGGLLTIKPLSALPTITDAVTIDGLSPLGTPLVELDGSLAGPGVNGLTLAASSSTIRGLVINRFSGAGILIESSTENHVYGNYIGTDAAGKVALGNGGFGLEIDNSFFNAIGTAEPGGRNVISGNAAGGIFIHGGSAFANAVTGNLIGTQLDGVSPLGNGGPGVLFDGDALLNSVGSDAAGASNTVAFNAGTGVLIRSGEFNDVQENSIFANGGLGIDLGGDGVTANDAGDSDAGANDLANYPVLTFVASYSGKTYVNGSLNSTPKTSFTLEFYVSAAVDPSGFGEGQTFLGSATVTTDAAGQATFDVTFDHATPLGSFVTATARDPNPNTSEFSRALQVPLPAAVNAPVLSHVASYNGRTFLQGSLADQPNASYLLEFCAGAGQTLLGSTTVITDATGQAVFDVSFMQPAAPGSFVAATARDVFNNVSALSAGFQVPVPTTLVFTVNTTDDVDDGVADATHTSLREAILAANRHEGPATIRFNIPGLNRTISPLSPLPDITDPVTIDGTTQPGFQGLPLIELDGSRAGFGADGLRILGGGSVVRGLVINRFQGDPAFSVDGGGHGIVLLHFGGNRLEGNFLGTDVTGTNVLANPTADVFVKDSTNNVVGGTTAAARNVLLAVLIDGYDDGNLQDTSGNRIQGNYIGTDVTGTAQLRSTGFFTGIIVTSADGNLIGGTEAGAGNVVSGEVDLLNANDNIVQGNLIGTDFTGTVFLSGVVVVAGTRDLAGITAAHHNVIGGVTPAARNVIAGGVSLLQGTAGGVVLLGGNATQVQGNYIGTNITGTTAISVALNNSAGHPPVGVIDVGQATTIGGTAPGAGNVITGVGAAVWLNGVDCVLQGNLIGLDATGSQALLNSGSVSAAGTHNTVGGLSPGAGNVMVGPQQFAGSGTVVEGNFIATDRTGTRLLGGDVRVAGDVLLGGTAPGARNLIAGTLTLDRAQGAVIQGNLIGTDVTGMSALGNAGPGVVIHGSQNNVIGGSAPGAGNVISGNGGGGLLITDEEADVEAGRVSAGNVIQGNKIGTDVTGTHDLGNGGDGVSIVEPRLVVGNNLIGGRGPGAGTPAAGNLIAFNRGAGVDVLLSTGNTVAGNAIFGNAGPGITNGIDGTLSTYAEARAQNLSAGLPVLTSAASDATGTVLAGTLTGPPLAQYVLDFYANAAFDPSGFGAGQTFLQSSTVRLDSAGRLSFQIPLASAVPPGQWITATATDASGTTSQFSRAVPVVAGLAGDTVQFAAPAYVVTENGGSAVVVVTRTGSTVGPLTVGYATRDGSATAGGDYAATAGTLNFAAGEASQTLFVPIREDNLTEGNESFAIDLSNPGGAELGAVSKATVTIADNDAAGQLAFASSTYTVREGFRATVQVTRSGGSRGRVSVDYRITGGTATPFFGVIQANADYPFFYGTLTFEDGQTTASFDVNTAYDPFHPVFEGPETIQVALGHPTGGATLGVITRTVVTITDEQDRAGSFGFPSATFAANETDGTVLVEILRRGPLNTTLTVDFATRDGTATAGADYQAAAGTLTFLPGEQRKLISITLLTDMLVEGLETFQVVLSHPTGGAILEPGSELLNFIIQDQEYANNLPGRLVLRTGVVNENTSGGFTVERHDGNRGVVTVHYTTSDGTATAGLDYTPVSGTLIFNDGETVKSVPIPFLRDSLVEGDEAFFVTLSDPTGGATISGTGVGTVTIFEMTGEFQLTAQDCRVAESNAGFTVTVELTGTPPPNSARPPAPLTVDYQVHDGTAHAGADYTAVSGTLSFFPLPGRQTFTIPIVNDLLVESNETIFLTLSNPTNGAHLGSRSTATLTILDEDLPVVSDQVSAGGPYALHEGDALDLSASVLSGTATDFTWDVNGDGVFGDALGIHATLTWAQLNALGVVDGPSTFAVRVRAKDSQGRDITSAQTLLTVANVAPTATLGNGGTVAEGTPGGVTFAGAFDASPRDQAAGFRYSYDFDNDGTFEVLDSLLASAVVPAAYLDDGPGSRTVRARITDQDGGFTDYQTAIAIANVAPTATLQAPTAVDQGSPFSVALLNGFDPSTTDSTFGFHYAFALDGTSLDGATYANSGSAAAHGYLFNDAPGDHTILARIFDKDGGYSDYLASVHVNQVVRTDHAPLARNDCYQTDEDTPLTISAQVGVLANDCDADSDPLRVRLVRGPRNGSLTLNPDGSFSYVPYQDFNGTDDFQYVANDGQLDSAPATVKIAAKPVLDPLVLEKRTFLVRGMTTELIRVRFDWTFRQAAYNNEVGVVRVDDVDGRIGNVRPGDPGYLQAALATGRWQRVFRSGTGAGATTILTFHGGDRFMIYIVQNAPTEAAIPSAPRKKTPLPPPVFFMDPLANPDHFDHVRIERRGDAYRLAWEDLTGGGDRDFNDVVLNIQTVISTAKQQCR
jgi:CSLREA domain-containing protein